MGHGLYSSFEARKSAHLRMTSARIQRHAPRRDEDALPPPIAGDAGV